MIPNWGTVKLRPPFAALVLGHNRFAGAAGAIPGRPGIPGRGIAMPSGKTLEKGPESKRRGVEGLKTPVCDPGRCGYARSQADRVFQGGDREPPRKTLPTGSDGS